MTSDGSDRGTRLTFEIFPSIVSYKLAQYVEEIIDQHEDRIRRAVLRVLRGGSFNSDPVSPEVIFTAVAQLGMALFCVALDRMAVEHDNNPPECYDEIADRLYQEVIDFVVRKYTSAVSEIPGLRRTCRRTWMDELRRVLLQIREKTKREVHALSMRSKELEKWILGGRLTPPPEHIAPYVDKLSSGERPAEGATQGADSRSTTDVIGLRKERRKTSKPVRRSTKYEAIDRELIKIAKARPKSHEEVFRFLDGRTLAIPNRRPFKDAGGWLKGFHQNRHAASVWLSQAWGRLGLPPFAPGPKK
jgi:hypothetical protein